MTDAPKAPDYFATEYQSRSLEIRRIALVSNLTTPEIDSIDLGFTQGEGAAGGAAGGALTGAGQALDSLARCSGDFCGAAFLLLLPVFMVGGAIVGAVSGAHGGHAADMLAEAEADARQMLNSPYLQTELLEHAAAYGRDNVDLEFIRIPGPDPETPADKPGHARPSHESVDAVLEVELLRLGLEYSLEMEARARLISTRTGAVLSDSRYSFTSERQRLDDWIADGSAKLTEAIQRGLQTIAEDLIDENFLLFYPIDVEEAPVQQAGKTGSLPGATRDRRVPHYVLSPVYPALETCVLCEKPFAKRSRRAMGNLKFVEVSSVQPTLQWERFPREHDRHDIHGGHHEISDVRYDLRVFDTAIPAGTDIVLVPARLVYDARDISETRHTVASALQSCNTYFWTVRARFSLDGRARVTEWAGAFRIGVWSEKPWNLRRGLLSVKPPPDWLVAGMTGIQPPVPDGPEWFYYPFMTPCNSEPVHEPASFIPVEDL